MTYRWDSTVRAKCADCGHSGSPWELEMHSCTIAQTGGRCEDYPACGHTDGDGCQPLPSHTSEYWQQVMTSGRSAMFYEPGTPEWYDALDMDEQYGGYDDGEDE